MAKPVISSTFFTFPKFLLWSLPLFFLLIGTWFTGHLDGNTISGLLSNLKSTEQQVVSHLLHKPLIHDSSFTPDYILRVEEREVTQSCITKSNVLVINGTSPGPELRLTEGKVYWIRVFNDMAGQNLTMHWHGLSMAVSPFSDGTPGASQWPIPPMHYFDYELEVEIGHAGTYFYHSHVGFQAVTAAGPLIVEDVGKLPYEYDEERIIAIQDVFEKSDKDIEEGLIGNPFEWSGEPANMIVNGKGHIAGNGVSDNCELAHITVEPEKTYRFRFIGGTALSFVSLAFEDHSDMTLIEADGDYTQPVNVSHLQIGSGQRFSVLFRTKARSELNKHQFFLQIETRDRPKLIRSYAVLEYSLPSSKRIPQSEPIMSSPASPPLSLPPTTLGWLDHQLLSLTPDPDFPAASDVSRRITIRTHQILRSGTIVWAQDDEPWIETYPTEPYLVSLYKNDSIEYPSIERASGHQGIDPLTRAFPAAMDEVIEIIIQNTGSDVGSVDVHPFHAHGAHYFDLGSGNGSYHPDENNARIAELPGTLARRDTTMLYKYTEHTTPGEDMGWRAWRLRVTEPGVWMIHCHILQHMVMGMQTVWVMGDVGDVLKHPFEHVEGYLDYGGEVYGNDTHDPTAMHFKGLKDIERWFGIGGISN